MHINMNRNIITVIVAAGVLCPLASQADTASQQPSTLQTILNAGKDYGEQRAREKRREDRREDRRENRRDRQHHRHDRYRH